MNYRHAFHAGNAADCLKHSVLVWLLGALRRKETAFFVLDTHAGAGRFDLAGPEAARTGEWQGGIARLLDDPPAPLRAYVELVATLGLYPGSPALIRALLRQDDRMACCELQPDAFAALRLGFGRDPVVALHQRDGWEALRGLLPPVQRRGLVLIDPPYEREDEYDSVVAGLVTAAARFPGGMLAAWYPIKHRAPVRALHDRLRACGMRDIVAAELLFRTPTDPARLNGSGLLVVRPPYRFEAEATAILAALLARLGDGEAGAGFDLLRLVDE